MEAFLVSTGVVALAEIGDKTQLLAMILAARFRRPLPIIAGIFAATILNHLVAAYAGSLLGHWLDGPWMRWILGGSFLAVAVWTLFPDKVDDDAGPVSAYGAFTATLIAFFLAEIGDKTQIATIALAARYSAVLTVAAGTTLGMLLVNAPTVLLGHIAGDRLPLSAIRTVAAIVFAALGLLTLLNIGG